MSLKKSTNQQIKTKIPSGKLNNKTPDNKTPDNKTPDNKTLDNAQSSNNDKTNIKNNIRFCRCYDLPCYCFQLSCRFCYDLSGKSNIPDDFYDDYDNDDDICQHCGCYR